MIFKNKLTVKSSGYTFQIEAEYTGKKAANWKVNGKPNYNHHNIFVRCKETGERIRFDFWCSIANPRMKESYDLGNAFYCFVTDALSGLESEDDFINEFGYTGSVEQFKVGLKAYKGCVNALNKLTKLIQVDPDNEVLYDLANDLSEKYG